MYPENTQSLLQIFDENAQLKSVQRLINSPYSAKTHSFIPRILWIPTDSFKKFREGAKINPDIFNDIIFFGNFKGTLLQKSVCMSYNFTLDQQGKKY
jgi:hypothetical protein